MAADEGHHHRLRREDLPEDLRPLFDALTFEIHRVRHHSDALRRERFWNAVSLGGCVVAAVINIVLIAGRAL